jgi:hypothetical protein
MRSEVSESSQSELPETLNPSALNTNTQAAVADLPSAGSEASEGGGEVFHMS